MIALANLPLFSYLVFLTAPWRPLLPPPDVLCKAPTPTTVGHETPYQIGIYSAPTDPEFGVLVSNWKQKLDITMGWNLRVYNKTLAEFPASWDVLDALEQSKLEILKAQLEALTVPRSLGHHQTFDISSQDLDWSYWHHTYMTRSMVNVEIIKIKRAVDGTLASPQRIPACKKGWCKLNSQALLLLPKQDGSTSNECRATLHTTFWGVGRKMADGAVSIYSPSSSIHLSYLTSSRIDCHYTYPLFYSDQGVVIGIHSAGSPPLPSIETVRFRRNTNEVNSTVDDPDKALDLVQEGEELDWVYGRDALHQLETEGVIFNIVNRTYSDLQAMWIQTCQLKRELLTFASSIRELFPGPLVRAILGHTGFVVTKRDNQWYYKEGSPKKILKDTITPLGWSTEGLIISFKDHPTRWFLIKCGTSAWVEVTKTPDLSPSPLLSHCYTPLTNGSSYDLVTGRVYDSSIPHLALQVSSGYFSHSNHWRTSHSPLLLQDTLAEGTSNVERAWDQLSTGGVYASGLSHFAESLLGEAESKILWKALGPNLVLWVFILGVMLILCCLLK